MVVEKYKRKDKGKNEEKEKLAIIKKAEEIINALNRLLDMLFTKAKMRDYIVHFVEPNAKINFLNRRFIKVFSNLNKFLIILRLMKKTKESLLK